MTKRQIRISINDLHKFAAQNVNFILKNQSVILAELISIQSGQAKIRNTRGHVLHLPLDQIDEVWAEEKVA